MTLRPLPLLLAASALALAVSPALAEKGGNGHGNANGHSNGNSASHGQASHGSQSSSAGTTAQAKPGKGDLASELKGLNAVRANPNALEHASPNSQVGRIAAYRDAALLTGEKADALAQAQENLAGLPVPTRGVADIDAEIAGLDPNADGYAETLATLQAERDAAQAYADASAAAEAAAEALAEAQAAEDAALLVASGGRVLSDEAVAYIRDVLNL